MTTANTSADPSEVAPRLPALDGVRGLAILLVMIFHFAGPAASDINNLNPNLFDETLLKATEIGWIGVNLFFVLSGFLITTILCESRGEIRAYFRNFYARRALRIVPVYFVSLAFLILLLPIVIPSESSAVDSIRENQLWLWTYLLSIKIYFDPAIQFTPYIGHLWSLAVEEQFYLVWPIVVLLFRGRILVGMAAAAVIIAVALRVILILNGDTPFALYYFTPTRMDDLAMGALIALLIHYRMARDLLLRFAWPSASIAFTALLILFAARGGFDPFDKWMTLVGFSVIGILFASVISGVLLSPKDSVVHKIFGHASLTFLGKYSYAIYVVHWPVAIILAGQTSLAGSAPTVSDSILPGIFVFSAAATAVSLGIALLSWSLIERPLMRFRSRFPQGNVMSSISRLERPESDLAST